MKHVFLFGIIYCLTSCSSAFLDIKPNSDIVIPTTLEDCRRLLDGDGRIGQGMNLKFPSLGQLASDEYYYNFSTWQSTVYPHERTAYIWADDVYEGEQHIDDWEDAYHAIYICNVVLDVLDRIEIEERNQIAYNDVKGTALFFRAMWYHALAEVFCLPYNDNSAAQTLGLPLRTKPNVDEITQRSTLAETYEFILADIDASVNLLADKVPSDYRNRPSVCAAFALTARIQLVMGDYQSALASAQQSLELYDQLLDYNDFELEGDAVFDRYNPEVLVMTQIKGYLSIGAGNAARNSFVDSTLIELYHTDDLRRHAFFTFDEFGQASRKSLYTTSISLYNCFNGPATDEVLLIEAECLARIGELNKASQSLNILLSKRMVTENFEPLSFNHKEQALRTVLEERRKELVFRGARWSDVRRLNVEGAGIQMKRVLNGESFVLEPNSPRYAFPIPESEILFSNIKQNVR